MRPIWSGSLSFGLINIPVSLYSGANDIGIDLDMIHKDDHAPIRYLRVCSDDGEEVPWDDIVRGYKLEGGEYVVISDEDIKKAQSRKSSTIDIHHFTEEGDIDTIYLEKPYYLEPKKGAEKAYALLREALIKSGKVGVATFVLRTREHLAIIKPERDALMLVQMRFEQAIRRPTGLKFPSARVRNQELKTALTLIEHLTEPFKQSQYKDTYTEDLKKMIKAKAKGKPVKEKGAPARPNAKVEDIMTLLKKSLDAAPKREHAVSRSRR